MQKKVLVVDGQGGGLGKNIIEQLKLNNLNICIVAVGTNALATNNMLKAGADYAITGENAIIFNCQDADIIIGPIGIVIANSLMGEFSPAMTQAIGSSHAVRLLLPHNKCKTVVLGSKNSTMNDNIAELIETVKTLIE